MFLLDRNLLFSLFHFFRTVTHSSRYTHDKYRYYAFDDDVVRSQWHNYEHADDEAIRKEHKDYMRKRERRGGKRNVDLPMIDDDDDDEEEEKRCRRTAHHRDSFPSCNTFHETAFVESDASYVT